jgi:hypothetical protein
MVNLDYFFSKSMIFFMLHLVVVLQDDQGEQHLEVAAARS